MMDQFINQTIALLARHSILIALHQPTYQKLRNEMKIYATFNTYRPKKKTPGAVTDYSLAKNE